MKVGIITAHNMKYSPYANYYINILDEMNINYELIIPNKEKIDFPINNKKYIINWNSKLPSMINYAIYSLKTAKLIKKRKYDKLIILTTINVAYLSLFLNKYFKNNYIVDIRDYTHEDIPLFYKLECIGIKNAGLRIISSQKFKNFLPDSHYHIVHNFNYSDKINIEKTKKIGKVIKIAYVGSIEYKKQCKKMIDLVYKDSRFEFLFYGNEKNNEIKEYVDLKNCQRIKYYGAYEPKEKGQIIKNIDILFNIYGNGCPLLDYALSNKLYDALYFKKLLLVSPDTFMQEESNYFSYAFDFRKETNLDDLYKWIREVDRKKIEKLQNNQLNKYIEENYCTKEKIINFIKE